MDKSLLCMTNNITLKQTNWDMSSSLPKYVIYFWAVYAAYMAVDVPVLWQILPCLAKFWLDFYAKIKKKNYRALNLGFWSDKRIQSICKFR